MMKNKNLVIKMRDKVGSCATTSIDFNTWFNDEQKAKTIPKNKKLKTKKKIVYPIFVEYANITMDIFWAKKFNIWANGKLPKNFSVTDSSIIFEKDDSVVICDLTHNYVTDTKLCIQFFKNYGGFFSVKDQKEEIVEYSSTPASDIDVMVDKQWNKIDKTKQEIMIKNYVHNISTVLSLNTKESNLLLQTVKLAVYSKNFNKNNIVIEHEKIINIINLMWDKDTRTFKADYAISKSVRKQDDEVIDLPKDMIPQYNSKIEKYYESYEKKYLRYTK